MPYINAEDRIDLDDRLEYILAAPPETAGELQYVIATLIQSMLDDGYRYQDLNDIMGALAGAQMEFYRQVVAPYEDIKLKENGGTYNV